MKKVLVAMAVFMLTLSLQAQRNGKAGVVKSVDTAKKEIIVSYDSAAKPFKIGDVLSIVSGDNEITLKVIYPMQTHARCELVNAKQNEIRKIKVGMIAYFGASVEDKDGGSSQKDTMQNVKTRKIAGIDFVLCPKGSYMMGALDSDKKASAVEKPRHRVNIDSFWIGKYEVTKEQYQALMGSLHWKLKGSNQKPVTIVSWYDAVEFCNALSARDGREPFYIIDKNSVDPDVEELSGKYDKDSSKWIVRINPKANGFRLPTEAEWEYACRAGGDQVYYWGDSDDAGISAEYAVSQESGIKEKKTVSGSSQLSQTSEVTVIKSDLEIVGGKKPNQWGIYDMIGNAWEWCYDRFFPQYQTVFNDNPIGPEKGGQRVYRGGSYKEKLKDLRSSNRRGATPFFILDWTGFRIVCPVDKTK